MELVASDAGGTSNWELKNSSSLDLQGAGVVQRLEDGSYQQAWLGDLPAGATRPLQFRGVNAAELYRAWKELDAYQSIEQRCRLLWTQAFGTELSVPLGRILELPEFSEFSNELIQYFRRSFEGAPVNRETRISFLQFKLAYSRLVYAPQQRDLGLGEIFDALTSSLSLSPGESRLLAHSSAPIGQHRLRPEATRATRSTLVLAHLKPPRFPEVVSDANALLDLLNRSDLDWLREDEDEAVQENSGQEDSSDESQGGVDQE